MFEVTHFQDNVHLTFIEEDADLLLMTSCRYTTKDTNPKWQFLACSIYAVASRALSALSAVFAEVRDENPSKYDDTSFPDFPKAGIPHSKRPSIVQTSFINTTKRLHDDRYFAMKRKRGGNALDRRATTDVSKASSSKNVKHRLWHYRQEIHGATRTVLYEDGTLS